MAEKFSPLLSANELDPRQMVVAWLYQFPDADLRESALRLLEGALFINRARRRELFELFLEGAPEGLLCCLSPLDSDRAKSADLLSYFSKDLGSGSAPVKRLNDWGLEEIENAPSLVFLDDFLGTGAQSTTLLSSWFGDEEGVRSTRDSDHALPEDLQAALREKPLTFYFLTGFEKGETALRSTCEKLGLKANIIRGMDAESEGATFDSVDFAFPGSGERLREFLLKKGKELLVDRNDLSDEERELFAFGYDGLGAIVAFDYSVPTSSITALWKTRTSDPFWMPVLPRYPAEVSKRVKEK